MASGSDHDEAPLEVSLSQTKQEIDKQIQQESVHRKRHQQNAKKRKPNWAKSKINDPTNDESAVQEPLSKKQRTANDSNSMQESDIFHHVTRKQKKKKAQRAIEAEDGSFSDTDRKHEIDDAENVQQKHENAEDEDSEEEEQNVWDYIHGDEDSNDGEENEDEVPQEVIDLFAKAIKESKTQQELEDKWQRIIEEQSAKYANLRHRLSKFDKVFVDGFQIEVNGVYRLNLGALKRAMRMRHFSTTKHRRVSYKKNMNYGSRKPSFGFVQGSVTQQYDLNNKKANTSSFWGMKVGQTAKNVGNYNDQQLQRFLDY
eukprot:CAMPEP_0197033236 /NCGR_PEP_ID=MMETSP1384-20130603/11697_1 /TAXON_ID=29189 /ORGANISM="Ammonia sp." /LENGTH=313 /DNA_ID=CAMNT_0042463021 /DNA_START=42 /DNA_END=983 /DNA_ORIENTATION=-